MTYRKDDHDEINALLDVLRDVIYTTAGNGWTFNLDRQLFDHLRRWIDTKSSRRRVFADYVASRGRHVWMPDAWRAWLEDYDEDRS